MNSFHEYVIVATSFSSASEFAGSLRIDDWFFVPSSSIDKPFDMFDVNVFRRCESSVFNLSDYMDLDVDARGELSLENQWYVRLILSNDFWVASKYAGKRSFWLHAWTFVDMPNIIGAPVEYSLFAFNK